MLASLACAPRRLACRYWAGRVALRENRAPTHRFTAPRQSEAGAPLCPTCAPPAPGTVLLGDSTLMAWYLCLYAPRTGGAYDSHHRTAEIVGRARRRCVAAGRAGATTVGSDFTVSWSKATVVSPRQRLVTIDMGSLFWRVRTSNRRH